MEMNSTRVVHINEVWYVLKDDVASVGVDGNVKVVALKEGKAWNQVYFTPGTANLDETPNIGRPGQSFGQRFQMSLPGEEYENNADFFEATDNRPMLLKLVQNNGIKLLGSLDVPCRMRSGYSMLDSGTVVRVERESVERVPWLKS